MPPFKPPLNFKFKYFYTFHNLSDGTPLVDFNVTSNIISEIQSKSELATSKSKQGVIDVHVIYSCLDFHVDNPSLALI
jgi:hypothetical protein